MSNIIDGCARVASDLYRSAILAEVDRMRREGVFVCFANIQTRLAVYNQDILWNTLWSLAREGALK